MNCGWRGAVAEAPLIRPRFSPAMGPKSEDAAPRVRYRLNSVERQSMSQGFPKHLVVLAGLALVGSAGFQLLLSALPGELGAAYSKDGGSGGEGGGSDDGGSDNSGSGSDSSGSGSGSGGDNSGPGSGDDDDDNSGSGKGRRDEAGKRDAVRRYLQALQSHGRVASTRVVGSSIDVRYDDGWRETINGNRYRLIDPNGRRVVERSAVRDDFRRLRAVVQ
jgi:hypothetical protein